MRLSTPLLGEVRKTSACLAVRGPHLRGASAPQVTLVGHFHEFQVLEEAGRAGPDLHLH